MRMQTVVELSQVTGLSPERIREKAREHQREKRAKRRTNRVKHKVVSFNRA